MAATGTHAAQVGPHGGRLVDRVLRGEPLIEARDRAASLKRISLNARMMSDVELLAVGAYSPLEGFMNQADYASVLRDMRLTSFATATTSRSSRRGRSRSGSSISRSASPTTATKRPGSSTGPRTRGI